MKVYNLSILFLGGFETKRTFYSKKQMKEFIKVIKLYRSDIVEITKKIKKVL